MRMTSSKPYLIRAIYEWIQDNTLTPYLAVDVNKPGVQVPQEFVEDGKIVLNISAEASRGLNMDNIRIVFTARFAGIPRQIVIPTQAVMAIYAKENGRGMVFNPDDDDGDDLPPAEGGSPSKGPTTAGSTAKRPSLKVVK